MLSKEAFFQLCFYSKEVFFNGKVMVKWKYSISLTLVINNSKD